MTPLPSRRSLFSVVSAALLQSSLLLGQTSTQPATEAQANASGTAAPGAAETSKPAPRINGKQRALAEQDFLRGAKHMEQQLFQAAEADFAHAVAADPTHTEYLAALAVAREHRVTALLQQAAAERSVNPAGADATLQQARALDGTNPRVQQHGATGTTTPAPVRRTQLAGSIALKPNSSIHSFHQRADVRALAAEIAADYGLRVALDPELKSQTVRIDVDDVAFDSAMRVFRLLTGTFFVPLDATTFVVATDTPDNRTQYERLVEETFFLPGFSADQLKDFVSIAQNVLSIRQVSVSPGGGSLVVRGSEDRVAAVESIFADLLQGTGDVVLDIKLYSIDKQNVRNLGVVLPQSFSAFSLASEAQSVVSANSALVTQLVASGVIPSTASVYEIAAYLVFGAGVSGSSLLTNSFLLFGGGLTTGVLSAGSIPSINLALNSTEARALDDLQLRVSDRQQAIFKSGTRYPIQTSLYSDIASSTSSSLANTTVNGVSLASLLSSYLGTNTLGSSATIPQIQYEDLGLTVTAVPRIERTGDVGMHLEVKVSALAGSAINGIPILASRQFSSDLTIHNGDTMMMISNTTQSETNAVNGVPGLSELPGFQSTTNSNSTKITGDLVLMITPHIVRAGHTRAKGPYVPLSPRPSDE